MAEGQIMRNEKSGRGLMNRSGETTSVVYRRRGKRILAMAAAGGALGTMGRSVKAATDTWTDATSNFNSASWTGGNAPPQSGDSLVFGAAGAGGVAITDDLMTAATFNIAGITFNGPA